MATVPPLDVDELAALRYADAEALLIDWLAGSFAGIADLLVANELPQADELQALLDSRRPFVHVEGFGGTERNPAQDQVNIDVDLYWPGDADGNPDREGAQDFARLIRAALLFRLPGWSTADATVSEVSTFSRPSPRPYDVNPTVRRIGAAYQLVIKSH